MSTASLARSERSAIADLFDEVGPDAPTLCEGWTTADLAAHIVVRERRPDTGPGLLIPALSSWTERVRLGAKARGYTHLVDQVRSGPPAYSPFALLDGPINGTELFIHHEDVRRAKEGTEPRHLDAAVQDQLWKRVTSSARLMLRKAPVGVVLQRVDGPSVVAKRAVPSVTVVGAPAELLLFASGRQGAARVDLTGDAGAVERLRAAHLGI